MIRLSDSPFDPGALLSDFCRGRAEVAFLPPMSGG